MQMATAETRRFRAVLAFHCANHGEVQRIADRAGITRPYLSKVLHGKAVPSIEIASKIATALDITLADMVAEKISADAS